MQKFIMKDEDPFYVGWLNDHDPEIKAIYRTSRWWFFGGLILISGITVWLQKPFNDHRFEYGNLTQITGRYFDSPFPILLADSGQLPYMGTQSILLVGYGKFGAEGIIHDIVREHGVLNGKQITLEGTLIYGDGKILLELTNAESSLIEIYDDDPALGRVLMRSPVALSGEIIDPKCYFGVMKPGEGKIHKSCAIRCISGGIPPVFRHETGKSEAPYRYYLMLDNDHNTINQEVLPFIAQRMNLQGNAGNYLGWDIIYLDLEQLN